jgi:transcription antitermination factor NusG
MPSSNGPNWFALTVRPNHERAAEQALSHRGLEAYVPLYRARKQWSDRVKNTRAPLFPGYIFCRFSYRERMEVLNSPGVRSIVGSGRDPAPVDESEISSVRALVSSGRPILPWPYLHAGERVVIRDGPLASLRGVVVRVKNTWRVVVSVEALSCSVAVELDAEALGAAS